MVLYMYMRSISSVCVNDLEYAGIMIFKTQTKTIKDTVIASINTITYTNTHPVNCKIYSIQLNKYIFHCSNLHVIKARLAFYVYCAYFRKTENILHDSLIIEILRFGTVNMCDMINCSLT